MSPNGARVAFELDRFEVTAEDRLEVTGRWSGVRGMRFMRPSLTVRTEDGERNLLALLEHKPWAAEEGTDWMAAFPWKGGSPDPGQAELAVAPSIVVDLAPDVPRPTRKRTLSERLAEEKKRSSRLAEEADELRQEAEALTASRDAALAEQTRLSNELAVARNELAAARREREQALRERDAARREREQLIPERDEAIRQLEAALSEQAEVAAKASGLTRERDTEVERLTRERDAALRQRDKARGEIEQAERERDAAVTERNEAVNERIAAETERDSALGRGSGAPLVEPPPLKQPTDWLGRALAVMAIITVLLVVFAIVRFV